MVIFFFENCNFEYKKIYFEQKMDMKSYFEEKCKSAKTANDIRAIVEMIEKSMHSIKFNIPHYFYNDYIGWALPTDQVCRLILAFWKRYSESKVIDLGCGSGFFCMMLHDCGIPKTKLMALETKIQKKATTLNFWEIKRDDDYEIDPNDILLICWGTSAISKRLESYIKRGGKYVLILGETKDGCTFPSDYFLSIMKWQCKMIHVQGPASNYSEYLSINVRC